METGSQKRRPSVKEKQAKKRAREFARQERSERARVQAQVRGEQRQARSNAAREDARARADARAAARQDRAEQGARDAESLRSGKLDVQIQRGEPVNPSPVAFESAASVRERANAAAYREASERKRILLPVTLVCLALLLAGGVGLGTYLTGQASQQTAMQQQAQDADQSQGQAPATEADSATQDPEADNANDAENAEKKANDAEPADLTWRDTDFAVDPARTDWNYESNGEKVVYLTIDDGPSMLTEQVLDILDRYDAKATFFVVGVDPTYYPMIKEAYDRGHTIGMHTYTHDYATVYSSVDAYYADLNQIAAVVQEQIGYVPCFIRFPGGSSNSISANYCPGIMSTLTQSVQEQGYQYYDWNMSTGDGDVHTTDEIIAFATEPTEMENIVLLCHDSETKQSTVDALPAIIEHYQALGYEFRAIDRSSIVTQHEVYN